MDQIRPLKLSRYKKVLAALGCEYSRTKGSHLIYRKAGVPRPIVCTTDREVSIGIQQSNRRTLGLSTEEYLAAVNTLI
ncbi:MAG: type II toxin-antitoxin system HicA family toxin [Patescibacteria group bacterium]|nr:type II toxin-antitoxin system HicA family toxin [Patescibacteria group bacterium]